MATDTSERGLERLICAALTGKPCYPPNTPEIPGPAPGEITKRGTIDVLRNGLRHGNFDIDVFFGTPSPENATANRQLTMQSGSFKKTATHFKGNAVQKLVSKHYLLTIKDNFFEWERNVYNSF